MFRNQTTSCLCPHSETLQTLRWGSFVWILRPAKLLDAINPVLHVFLLWQKIKKKEKNQEMTGRYRDKKSHLVAKRKLKCLRYESPPDLRDCWMETGDVRVCSHRWQEFHCHLRLLLLLCLRKNGNRRREHYSNSQANKTTSAKDLCTIINRHRAAAVWM